MGACFARKRLNKNLFVAYLYAKSALSQTEILLNTFLINIDKANELEFSSANSCLFCTFPNVLSKYLYQKKLQVTRGIG